MNDRLGFIRDKLDIKILILFVLGRVKEPLSMEEIADAVICDDGISYFDFAECLADLESTDHISQENGLYSITDKGQKNGSVTEGSLPYSVRVRAERNAASLAVSKSRGRLISTSRTVKHGGGYTVTMSLSDGLDTIMLLQMYAPAEKQAQKMEQVFKNRAENIHSVIISELEKE